MKNYTKPSANVIELAVKETLSRTASRKREYKIKIGQYTYTENRDIETNIYASSGVSKIRWSDEPKA